MKYIAYMLWILLWKVVFVAMGIGSVIMVIVSPFKQPDNQPLMTFLWVAFCISSFSLAKLTQLSPEKEKEIEEYIKSLDED